MLVSASKATSRWPAGVFGPLFNAQPQAATGTLALFYLSQPRPSDTSIRPLYVEGRAEVPSGSLT